jgi:Pro-kumamolisin, activation domain/Fibronectin type III domain/Tectonin domain
MQPAPLSRSGARLEKAAALGNVKHLRLYFTSPDAAALNSAAQAIASPSSPDYRHYLTVNQFRALYAPPAATTAAVNSYLTGLGLRVGPLDPNGMSEPVTGTIKQLNAALHTTLQQVRTAAGAQVVGATEAPALPANLAGAVTYIDGLTPWVQAHDNLAQRSANGVARSLSPGVEPALTRPGIAATQECSAVSSIGAGSSPEAMDPADLSSAYRFSGFYAKSDTGQTQTVGLIEYDSFDQPAVSVWEHCLGISPTVDVSADTTFPPPSSPQTLEATSDIETVMGLAPTANIAVYETGNVDQVDLDPWTSAIGGASGIPLPAVISSSWGLCESEATTQLGGGGLYAAESTLFTEAVAQGQSIFVASGDQGSEACYADGEPVTQDSQLAVNDPASNPLVTAVGGTNTITVTGTQFVWNTPQTTTDSDCAANLSLCVPGASGGGLSGEWDQPTYQPASTTLQTGCVSGGGSDGAYGGTTNGGCREVPDISALAGYAYVEACTDSAPSGPCDISGGTVGDQYAIGVGGTSLAAPSWAATLALTNVECKANIGFINPLIYGAASAGASFVGKVTSGNNDFTGTNANRYPAMTTGGQSLATGLGYLGGVDLSSDALCVPSAPAPVTATPSDGSISVSWGPSGYSGTSAVTGYSVSMTPATDPPCTVTPPAATSCTFSGLTNGSPYRFTLTASNSSGPGAPLTTSWVTPIPNISISGFNKVAGAAVTVSEGADGMVWVLGTASTGGGHPLYERIGNGWLQRAGGAVAIAVGPNGNPWVVNSADQIYAFNGSAFVHEPGAAVAVSVGANGNVWVLGNAAVSGGHPIYQWTGSTWVQQPGAATSIAVGPTGNPWVTNSSGNIFQWNGSGWNLQSGLATTIGEGSDGAVWVLGSGAAPGGHYIYLWTAGGWSSHPGGATAITVGPNGHPWVVNNTGAIYSS